MSLLLLASLSLLGACSGSGAVEDAARRDEDGDGAIAAADGGGDCDDGDAGVHPDAADVCDGIDNDCDAAVDELGAVDWYADGDGDGYGDPDAATAACVAPDGHTSNDLDCDDGDPDTHPAADEVCDGIDNDCDGAADTSDPEGALDAEIAYGDADGDGFGDASVWLAVCELSGGFVADGNDCDDGDDSVYPGAEEICGDDVDSDCDGHEAPPGALALGGTAWIEVPDHTDLQLSGLGAWTLEAWVYVDGAAIDPEREYVLIDKKPYYGASSAYTDYSVFLHQGTIYWGTGASSDACAWLISEMTAFDRWVHLAMVLDATSASSGDKQLYIDGELAEDCSYASRGSSDEGEPLRLGFGNHSAHDMLPGRFDEIRFSAVDRYGGADFTPSLALAADADTIALWSFDAGGGETVYDRSGNGHDGALQGEGYTWRYGGACGG